jgi:hypothetical protein
MADNFNIQDGGGSPITLAARDAADVYTPKHYIADGDNLALGATADAAASSDAGAFSLISLFKRLLGRFTAGATSLVKREDDAHASLDYGVQVLAVRRDAAAVSSGADGDYSTFNVDANGNLYVLASLATAQTLATVTTVSTLTGGGIAHDSVDSGNPVKVGAKATASLSGGTNVAAGDRSNLVTALDGSLLVRSVALEDIVSGNASNTDGTSTECIAAQAAGVKTYLTSIVLANTSGGAITVDIKDGSTVKLTIPLPANGGQVITLPTPLPGTAATAWNFDPSAGTTTVYCSMVGYKSKI